MFEQLIETEPQHNDVKNRGRYFIITSVVLCSTLFAALIFSLFAVDLNLGMGELDMFELIAPVEITEKEKLPEPEIAPKTPKQGGPSATASRQINMARIDESPRDVPNAVSTAQNTAKARPSITNFELGKFDTEHLGGNGSGRGDGTGDTGLGDGDETIATTEEVAELSPPPPPPVKKAVAEKPLIKSMGVVNSIAISLPTPSIPAAAKIANAAGTVSVQVLIDEKGNVISANAVSGNSLLRAASEAAAKSARFSPTMLSGQAIKISGVIHYHFAG